MILYDIIIIFYFVIGGCCLNVITSESIIKIENKCGYLITLCQFAFISFEGLLHNIKYNGVKKHIFPVTFKERKVPLYKWFFMVILFFSSSVINNLVFQFNISFPIHIIFRSSIIIVNMIMSRLILKRRYSLQQVLSIIIVTIGLIITTTSTSKASNKPENYNFDIKKWIIGIILLIISSIVGALMGIYQEYIFKNYPNSWKECLFYKHILSIPIFLFFIPQLREQWNLLLNTPKNKLGYYIPLILPTYISNIKVQGVWILLISNILTQYICISGVQKLSSICSSVTLNLILNVRKFISLLISVFLFKNPFSWWSWLGSIFVFTGVFGYAKATDIAKKREKLQQTKSKMETIKQKIIEI